MEEGRRRRRPAWLIALAVLLLLLLLSILILWLMRVRIATGYIEREFERRGVQASYRVTRIGFRTQRLEDLVIGDPRRPDLTARIVEVELDIGLGGVDVNLIRGRGVRMFGRIRGGKLTLGQVDKLLPPPTGLPFRLPNQIVEVSDAAIALDSPVGRFAIGISGAGNLSDGFRGQMAAVSRRVSAGECRIEAPLARVSVAVTRLRPTFDGPVSFASARCGGDLELVAPRFDVNVTLAQGFDAWRGRSRLAANRFRAGPSTMAVMAGAVSFNGSMQRTSGELNLGSGAAAVADFRAGRTRVAGTYAIVPRSGELTLRGEVALGNLTVGPRRIAPLADLLRSAAGSPVGPIGDLLANALTRAAASGAEARATLSLVNGEGFGGIRFQNLSLASRSGARLRGSGGRGVTYYWPGRVAQLDGDFAIAGGGFPDARFRLRQARGGAAIEGVGRIAPLAAGEARLALGEIRFNADPRGATRIQTSARIDGPFKGGRVVGLSLPIVGRFGGGGFALGESCVPATFERLEVETLRLGRTRLPLCPTGRALVWRSPGGALQGGAELRELRLAGALGRSPLSLASDRVRLSLSEPGFTSSAVTVRLGSDPWVNRLDIDALTGRFNAAGVIGTYAGLTGKLANVPLLISEGSGNWQVQRGDLLMTGGVTVADEQDPPRFYPFVSNDFRLTMSGSTIRAGGWLRHPESGTQVTRAAIEHNLRTGEGFADLDVPGIRFGPAFQPEELTRLTMGVVALVEGSVTGRGAIRWRPGSTTSTGTFSTEDMNLAAAFGPVEGLTTSVEFTDLLGLVSAPGQRASVDAIRTGIDVVDGEIRYQLLPDNHVKVESGRWPFAGGTLVLEETILDFSQPSTRRLTFRVEGLEAEKFVQQMQFTSIAATGTFDGTIPMEFDIQGGRIVGGLLKAREGGGTLSYVGEISDENLGSYGRMAFDALKSLRYSRFNVGLDGALAGEFLARLEIHGINRNVTGTEHWLVRQLTGLPFRFNISIRGPIRAVIGTLRSMEDPSLIIQPVLPEALQELPTTVRSIQKEESEAAQ